MTADAKSGGVARGRVMDMWAARSEPALQLPSGTHLSLSLLPPAPAGDPGWAAGWGPRDLHPQPPHPWSGSGSRTGSSQVSDATPSFTGTPRLAGARRVLGELGQSRPFPARRCPGLFTGRSRSPPGSGFTERLLAVRTQRRPSLGTLPAPLFSWERSPRPQRGRGGLRSGDHVEGGSRQPVRAEPPAP